MCGRVWNVEFGVGVQVGQGRQGQAVVQAAARRLAEEFAANADAVVLAFGLVVLLDGDGRRRAQLAGQVDLGLRADISRNDEQFTQALAGLDANQVYRLATKFNIDCREDSVSQHASPSAGKLTPETNAGSL